MKNKKKLENLNFKDISKLDIITLKNKGLFHWNNIKFMKFIQEMKWNN